MCQVVISHPCQNLYHDDCNCGGGGVVHFCKLTHSMCKRWDLKYDIKNWKDCPEFKPAKRGVLNG